MLSSFLNKSPLKVVIPFKYSIGLVNMVEEALMETVFTNIQCRPQHSFSLAAKINCHRSTETQKRNLKGISLIRDDILVEKN